MSRVNPVPHYSLEDYDTVDRGPHGERFEFLDGEIIAMVGGTARHHQIVANVYQALARKVRPPCSVFRETFRLHVRAADDEAKFYPDLFVSCVQVPPEATEATDATVIVEVLSPSTADYDRDTKLRWYRKLPSLTSYALVNSEYKAVTVHQPTATGEWVLTVHDPDGRAGPIVLAPRLDLSLEDIYAGIDIE